jgi:hypothetical protein
MMGDMLEQSSFESWQLARDQRKEKNKRRREREKKKKKTKKIKIKKVIKEVIVIQMRVPITKSLRRRRHNWKKILAPARLLEIIEEGAPLLFHRKVPRKKRVI